MRVALLTLMLAGCAAGERPVAEFGAGQCDAQLAQALVGRPLDERVMAEARRLTRSKIARAIVPETSVTMDYRTDRVNITVDRTSIVTKIACG